MNTRGLQGPSVDGRPGSEASKGSGAVGGADDVGPGRERSGVGSEPILLNHREKVPIFILLSLSRHTSARTTVAVVEENYSVVRDAKQFRLTKLLLPPCQVHERGPDPISVPDLWRDDVPS